MFHYACRDTVCFARVVGVERGLIKSGRDQVSELYRLMNADLHRRTSSAEPRLQIEALRWRARVCSPSPAGAQCSSRARPASRDFTAARRVQRWAAALDTASI